MDQINRLPDACIDLTITSPPYFGLRTYTPDANPHELGREMWLKDYISNLKEVFAALYPKLKPTGSVFVVIGESYNGHKTGTSNGRADQGSTIGRQKRGAMEANERINKMVQPEVRVKSLLDVPGEFRRMMTHELGYICRNAIIWHKPNPMPNSPSDRWGITHEYILFFVKSNSTLNWINENTGQMTATEPPGIKGVEGIDWRWFKNKAGKAYKRSYWQGKDYYFDTQYEPFESSDDVIDKALTGIEAYSRRFGGRNKYKGYRNPTISRNEWQPEVMLGRIARDVWKINTQGRDDPHFATFPDEIPAKIIPAACPKYVCSKCGLGRRTRYKRTVIDTRPGRDTGNGKSGSTQDPNADFHKSDLSRRRQKVIRTPIVGGYTSSEYNGQDTKDYASASAPSPGDVKRSILKSMFEQKAPDGTTYCSCSDVTLEPGLVFDPFCGRGTVCIIARKLGRNYIGVDLSPEYCNKSRENLASVEFDSGIEERKKKKKRSRPRAAAVKARRKNTSILDFIGGVMEQ